MSFPPDPVDRVDCWAVAGSYAYQASHALYSVRDYLRRLPQGSDGVAAVVAEAAGILGDAAGALSETTETVVSDLTEKRRLSDFAGGAEPGLRRAAERLKDLVSDIGRRGGAVEL